MKLTNRMGAIFDRINNIFVVLASLFLVFIVLSVTTEVILRYFFNAPTLWIVEVNENNLLFITFLATAWVLRKDGHVKIELLLTRLSPRTRNLLLLITSIVGLLICLVLTWYSGRLTYQDFVRGTYKPSLNMIPEASILFIIPVGTFLLSVQFLRRTWNYFKSWREQSDIQTSVAPKLEF
jgi:TRAP-type C4-dicarboxylate transport system permease small subunit